MGALDQYDFWEVKRLKNIGFRKLVLLCSVCDAAETSQKPKKERNPVLSVVALTNSLRTDCMYVLLIIAYAVCHHSIFLFLDIDMPNGECFGSKKNAHNRKVKLEQYSCALILILCTYYALSHIFFLSELYLSKFSLRSIGCCLIHALRAGIFQLD
jgi:hypothetical protein